MSTLMYLQLIQVENLDLQIVDKVPLTWSDNDTGASFIVVVVLMLGNWCPSEVRNVCHLQNTTARERVQPGGTVVSLVYMLQFSL